MKHANNKVIDVVLVSLLLTFNRFHILLLFHICITKIKEKADSTKKHDYESIGYIENMICFDKSKVSLENNHSVKITRDKRDGEIKNKVLSS